MKNLIYIFALVFAVFALSSCQKTELDDLKPLKVNSEERVDSESYTPPGKGDIEDNNDSDNNGNAEDGITDDDDEDDDDELEGRETEDNNP